MINDTSTTNNPPTLNKLALLVNFHTNDTPDVQEIITLSHDLGFQITQILNFKANNKAFLGIGQMKMIAEQLGDAKYLIYNGFLSGLRLKKLEQFIKVPILSRIDIIIEIFESRASTPESKLQVKLAHLLHSKAKLVRLWTHLERQQGGARSTAGPGEKQIELDKRIINNKIEQIKKELVQAEQSRKIRNVSRVDPIISLVGYANAGKTSLFNLLTQENREVSSKAFQTLDSLLRTTHLSSGQKVIISDTVGFVTHLPPFLVKAFSATLDHIKQSDVIVCLHDITKLENIDQILYWLHLLQVDHKPIIHVLNKIDLVEDKRTDPVEHTKDEQTEFEDTQDKKPNSNAQSSQDHNSNIFSSNLQLTSKFKLNTTNTAALNSIKELILPKALEDAILISTKNNKNIDQLMEKITQLLDNSITNTFNIDYEQTTQLQWIIKHSLEHKLEYQENRIIAKARFSAVNFKRLKKLYPDIFPTKNE